MNTSIQTGSRRKGASFFYAGWAGFALFGIVAGMGSDADLSYAMFHLLVAAAVCTWYTLSTGRAAVVVGLILGTLFGLEMGLFLGSDFTARDESVVSAVEDFFGLVAAVLILSGAVAGLRAHRASSLVTS